MLEMHDMICIIIKKDNDAYKCFIKDLDFHLYKNERWELEIHPSTYERVLEVYNIFK